MDSLGYLGPQGTFSHTAALQYSSLHGYDPVCCTTLDKVVQQIANGKLIRGIVPVENSVGGAVAETMDLLISTDGLFVVDEYLLPIKQHLITQPGTNLKDITIVYSHTQALAQCRSFLKHYLPEITTAETMSTAAAALLVLKNNTAAAIGSKSAAITYDLEILRSDIQDNSANTTRFLVLSPKKLFFTPQSVDNKAAKTMLALALKDSPGALHSILKHFAQRDINLTRIESRPSGNRLGDYIFFIDLEGHCESNEVAETINELRKHTLWLKILGCYPFDKEASTGSMPVGSIANNPDQNLTDSISLSNQGTQPLNLPHLREKIDRLDDQLLDILAQRQQIVEKVAIFKRKDQIVDHSREEAIIDRLTEKAKQQAIDPDMVEAVFRQIFKEAVKKQAKILG